MKPADTREKQGAMEAPTTGARGGWWGKARHSRTGTLVVMGVTAAIILAVAYIVNRPGASGGNLTSVVLSGGATGAAPSVGKPAPDFTGTTVDGAKLTLSEFKGRPVWLTFGASWCQPCRAENPDIQAAYEKHRPKGLVVLAIFITEDASTVRDYATRVGLTYLTAADPNTQIASVYRILGIPSHFFIDRAGVLRALKVGSLDPAGMEAALGEIGG